MRANSIKPFDVCNDRAKHSQIVSVSVSDKGQQEMRTNSTKFGLKSDITKHTKIDVTL